jgi:hypothetical protein
MCLSWLPNTAQGHTVGGYVSTEVAWRANAFPVVPVVSALNGTTFNQVIFVPTGGLTLTGGGITAAGAPAG